VARGVADLRVDAIEKTTIGFSVDLGPSPSYTVGLRVVRRNYVADGMWLSNTDANAVLVAPQRLSRVAGRQRDRNYANAA
jgi:hypothetical protein